MSSQFCFKISNPELQMREIPYPEKRFRDPQHSTDSTAKRRGSSGTAHLFLILVNVYMECDCICTVYYSIFFCLEMWTRVLEIISINSKWSKLSIVLLSTAFHFRCRRSFFYLCSTEPSFLVHTPRNTNYIIR